jgi:cysteinyl-tRNA synthetase
MGKPPAVLAFVLLWPGLVFGADAPPRGRDYPGLMRRFVQDLSARAKAVDPRFLVVPQGGISLLGEADAPQREYLAAIDGVGQEEVFYGYDNQDDRPTPPEETAFFLDHLRVARAAGKAVLSIDYAGDRGRVNDALARNAAEGFIPFVADRRGLDGVPAHPERPVNENARDVRSFQEVKNFLYVIDGGRFGSKDRYIRALAATNHDLLVVDLFVHPWVATREDVGRLKVKKNGGKRLVLCYVSIGEAEDYRFYWKPGWRPGSPVFLGPENPDWKHNFAVKYWTPAWKAIFLDGKDSYLARVQAAGFDGIYLDKVDEFEWFAEHGE